MSEVPPPALTGLLAEARAAREHAWAPYSRFEVGAAVRGGSGRVYRGCNVENASYGLTICAERVAIASAVAAGERRITALAVVADTPAPLSPCGACRQVLAEFAPAETPVLLANLAGATRLTTAGALLPDTFTLDTGRASTTGPGPGG